MNTEFDVNVTRADAISRYLVSIVLMAAVLIWPATVPSWIALLACYPAFTALMQWDPINALFQAALSHTSKTTQDAIFRNSAEFNS